MNHRFIRSVNAKGRFAGLWLPLCFVAVIIFFHLVYPAVLGDLVSRVASPFWSGERLVGDTLSGALAFFESKQALSVEVARLSGELEQAQKLLLDRELLLEENQALKEQFGRATKEKERRLGAILAAPPQSLYDTAVIDVGSLGGVRVGDLALSGSAVLGTVSKVFSRTSLIEFFSTAGKKTEVSILHEGKAIPVTVEGKGGGEFKATLPKEVPVFAGDGVVLPKESLLLFAAVEAIEGSATDSFQTIRFKNPVSISSLRFLEIQRAEE